ncbi:MAG: hypothetical protein MAG551_01084 [Candidatus Scalindua arabica]|uniref:Uncharacterized protein n=1 Tax=Candidatus Scalindua arabica TaxID=1127984 RepID=A0A942A1V5_9BACT|nr:hypothetical protein [Candidatus Scalindua arabica]
MPEKQIHAVTGAYGYSGKYITRRLLGRRNSVITLTNSMHRSNLFGKEDILINNIAWALHKLPVFAVFGDGQYRLQPIYVDDLAELAVEHGEKEENSIINAVGPETFTYKELIQTIGRIIGKDRPIISVHPTLVYIAGMIISQMVNDVLITPEEIEGLMSNLLCIDSPPTGKTRLTDWIEEHAESLGRQYTSELVRRIDRETEYKSN